MRTNKQEICDYMRQFGYTLHMSNGGNTWFVFSNNDRLGVLITVSVENDKFMYQAEATLGRILTTKTLKTSDPMLMFKHATVLLSMVDVIDDHDAQGYFKIPTNEDVFAEWINKE